MNHTEHLLTCLAEECAEVAQRVSKALRFGLDEVQAGHLLNNAQRISLELRDLISVARMLCDDGVLDKHAAFPGFGDVLMKRKKIENFMAIAVEQGVLTEGVAAQTLQSGGSDVSV